MSSLPEKKNAVEGERIEDRPLIEVGQWYWMKGESGKWDWFGCVTHLGSNYVRLEAVGGNYERIHLSEFESVTKREQDPESVIRGRMTFYQENVQHKLGQIKEITARLGLDPRQSSSAPTSQSRELSTFNAMPDLKKYKKELIKAKDKTLPQLFKEVEKDHEALAEWMTARTIPMKAMAGGLEDAVEKIEDRVFNVSLYAGLTEEVERIKDGAPAAASEKLRLFQRMAFMDEECLANYRHGGMEFADIEEFDAWLLEPENLDRLLPWPRCMVAFRVRRHHKFRDCDGTLAQAFVNFRLERADKSTFMYIRNGGAVYRMTCELEFGEHIFPSAHQVDFTEPLMAKDHARAIDDIITKRHWEELCRERDEKQRIHDAWEKEHGHDETKSNPHWISSFDDPRRTYEPFNKSSVYYDDMEEIVAKQLKYYNRIALILQGLFDRSEVLHPHPPAKLWSPGGMEALVELVYDGAGAIHYGNPPDIKAYLARVNQSLGKGCFTIGQEDAWERREAEIENHRWNSRSTKDHEKYHPYGDPGPGYIAQIQEWQRTGMAIYRWTRERRSYGSYWDYRDKDRPIPCVIRVPADKLFNVSGYKPGDFRQFYQDPRTRAQYLEWAPLLIAAEEWHAGNLELDGNLKVKKKARRKS